VIHMGIKNAAVIRITNICNERNLAINALANLSGITPSTLYSIIDSERKDIGIVVIKKLCDGLGMTLKEFFDDAVFFNLDQEVK